MIFFYMHTVLLFPFIVILFIFLSLPSSPFRNPQMAGVPYMKQNHIWAMSGVPYTEQRAKNEGKFCKNDFILFGLLNTDKASVLFEYRRERERERD